MTRTTKWLSRLATVLYAIAVAGLVVSMVSRSIPGGDPHTETALDLLSIDLTYLAYATVGILILVRQPRNRIGWLVGAVGFFPLLSGLTDAYYQRTPGWPLAELAQWYGAWYFIAAVWTLPIIFLLFPDGRPASQRWRWPVLLAGTALSAELVRYMFGPGDCGERTCSEGNNPFQLDALTPFLRTLEAVGLVGLTGGMLAGVASLAWRFHRARGVERQQVKWFAGAVGLALLTLGVGIGFGLVWPHAYWLSNGTFAVAVAIPAVAVAVAVLRYRLYDIDRLISRTLSYAVLTALLLSVYLALITTSTRFLPDGSPLAVAASTLAAAGLFQPLRRRVQTLVDRRFNRARYDADHTIAAFSAQMREEVDLETVCADLVDVVHGTLQPTSAALWLRPGRDTS